MCTTVQYREQHISSANFPQFKGRGRDLGPPPWMIALFMLALALSDKIGTECTTVCVLRDKSEFQVRIRRPIRPAQPSICRFRGKTLLIEMVVDLGMN